MKNVRASELLDLLKNSYEDLFYNSKNKKEKKKFFFLYRENVMREILSSRWLPQPKTERIDIKLPRKAHRFLVEHGDNLPKHRFFAPKMPLSFSSPRVTDLVLSSRYKVGRSTKMQLTCEIWNTAKNLVTYIVRSTGQVLRWRERMKLTAWNYPIWQWRTPITYHHPSRTEKVILSDDCCLSSYFRPGFLYRYLACSLS